MKVAGNEEERPSLWQALRSVSPALDRKAPNKPGEDITVPRSALPEAVRRLKAIGVNYGLPVVVFGHAGDGNLHPNILFDKRDPGRWRKVGQMAEEEFTAALELGGTLSGEHGVGALKRAYLEKALGSVSTEIQKRIKRALDRLNILNSGKFFPSRSTPPPIRAVGRHPRACPRACTPPALALAPRAMSIGALLM